MALPVYTKRVSDETTTGKVSDLGVLVKLICSDIVDGENEFYFVGLCLFDKGSNLFRAVLVKKGGSNLFRRSEMSARSER